MNYGVRYANEHRQYEQMVNPVAYNNEVRDAWMPLWVRNAGRNWSFIEDEFSTGNPDIKHLPKGNGPCLIVGSGPSLDDAVPYLKKWKGDIFCSTSQLGLFDYLGMDPTYCAYIDADPSMLHLVTDRFQRTSCKTTLLTHPQMPLEAYKMWGGPRYYFRMYDPGDEFSSKFMPLMYQAMNFEEKSGVQSYVLNSGCVANAMIALAMTMGYSPIFLVGYDLAYPEKKRRFRNYIKNGRSQWEREEQEYLPPERPVFTSANGILTDELSVFYKLSFMILWGLGAPSLISCSRGLLYEVPWADPKSVIEAQGEGYADKILHPLQAYRVAQAYLKHRNVQILKTNTKVMTQNLGGLSPWKRQLEWARTWWEDRFARKEARRLGVEIS